MTQDSNHQEYHLSNNEALDTHELEATIQSLLRTNTQAIQVHQVQQ